MKSEAIDKAVSAHASWKARLRSAISNGKADIMSATAKMDNQCDFGKWLYSSEISPADKACEHYRNVKQLHAEFHREAGKVIDCVTHGKKNEAETSLAMGGSFAKASSALTEAMIRWRNS